MSKKTNKTSNRRIFVHYEIAKSALKFHQRAGCIWAKVLVLNDLESLKLKAEDYS